jgi:hypothetical protein
VRASSYGISRTIRAKSDAEQIGGTGRAEGYASGDDNGLIGGRKPFVQRNATAQSTILGVMEGSATKQGNTVNATGTATGSQGKTVTGEGSVTKTGNTVSDSGTMPDRADRM